MALPATGVLPGEVFSNIVPIDDNSALMYVAKHRGIPTFMVETNPAADKDQQKSRGKRRDPPALSDMYRNWTFVISPCGNFACIQRDFTLASGIVSCGITSLGTLKSRFAVLDNCFRLRSKDDMAFCAAIPCMMAFVTEDSQLLFGSTRSRTVPTVAGQPIFSHSGLWLVCAGPASGKPLVLHGTKYPKDVHVAVRGDHTLGRCATFLSHGDIDLLVLVESGSVLTVSIITYWTSTDTVTLTQQHAVPTGDFALQCRFYSDVSGSHLLLVDTEQCRWTLYDFAAASYESAVVCEKHHEDARAACFSADQQYMGVATVTHVNIYSTRTAGEPLFTVDVSLSFDRTHILCFLPGTEPHLALSTNDHKKVVKTFRVPNLHARLLLLLTQYASQGWPLPPAMDVLALLHNLSH